MKIAVAGTGYVGLSLATLLSQKNEVVALDVIPEKVEKINQRISPIQDKEIEEFFKTKELKLTSLMRDMYVEIPGHGHNKLNAAYAFGGVELLYQTIAKNFGIKIDNYCVVDFSTFEKVINKVGGVEISLEEKEAKYLNTTNYISKKKLIRKY